MNSGRVWAGGFLLHGTHLEVSIREGTKLGEGCLRAASSIGMEDIRLLRIINAVENEQAEEFWLSSLNAFKVSHMDVME